MEEATNKQPTSVASEQHSPFNAALLRRRRGGQAVVILALFMMLLLGLAGLVYDLGFARHEVSRAQRAADAAALAGVVFMPEHFFQSSQANATTAAQLTAADHGYSSGHVTPRQVPQESAQLEVDITSVYTTAFMGIFGFRTLPIKVVAVAEYNAPLTMGAPEPYLGVGSQLAVTRHMTGTNGDNSPMRQQNFWLSLHSPGTPKENGDPFLAKWDQTGPPYQGNGCGCRPVNGPFGFQPDHDTQGYNYGLYVADGTDAYLQVYDAAYQPKPGYIDGQGNAHINPTLEAIHPCGNVALGPGQCGLNTLDFNNIDTRWCASNSVETGDNAPFGGCDSQAAGATAVYTIYYPDSTPWYFEDDIPATVWQVPASPITGTNPGGGPLEHSYTYSQTWTNFAEAPDPGYLIYPRNGDHQWRLQSNVPLDNDTTHNGVKAQNNFALRLKTNFATTQIYAIQRLPVLATVAAGISDFYLANVPIEDQGKTLVVSLFDPGDALGTNYMQLIAPIDATHATTYPVYFDAYVHDKNIPPNPDIVYNHTQQLNTTRPQYDTNDKWIDLIYPIPLDIHHGGNFEGGYFQVQYVFQGQAQDRTAWRISIRGNPVHIVLGGG